MATTKNTKDKGKDKTPPDPNALRVELQHGDSQSETLAALATDGALTAITLQAYAGGGKELGVTELLTAMRKAGDETVAGDMGRFERVLTHQFLTLDALFNNLAQRSGRQDSFKGIGVLMRLALKAQSQARATAESQCCCRCGWLKHPLAKASAAWWCSPLPSSRTARAFQRSSACARSSSKHRPPHHCSGPSSGTTCSPTPLNRPCSGN